MPQVIGRVVTGVHETLRGPDVIHRVAIRREWLLTGETIHLTLPRNLSCASCEGGGCDRCGRSGAITLRSRGEQAEFVQVTLPRRTAQELRNQPTIVVRVPELGGHSAAQPELPRGLLLLKVVASAGTDAGIALASAAPLSEREEAAAAAPAPVSSVRPAVRRSWLLAALFAALWIALIFALATGVLPAGWLPAGK